MALENIKQEAVKSKESYENITRLKYQLGELSERIEIQSKTPFEQFLLIVWEHAGVKLFVQLERRHYYD